eukprot:405384-Hanusia_phi.AAC.3
MQQEKVHGISARAFLDIKDVEKDIDYEIMKMATKQILFPSNTSTRFVHSTMSNRQYLEACSQNILAEIWSLFENTFKNTFVGWRDKRLPAMRARIVGDEVVSLLDKDGKESSIDEYVNNVFLVRDSWCLLRHSKEGYVLQQGISLSRYDRTHHRDIGNAKLLSDIHLVGYFKPYISDLYWIYMMLNNSVPSGMLGALIDTSRRKKFEYASHVDTSLIPINNEQLEAIQLMKTDVEGIQGPPGTGKSTTIYHIVKGLVPQDMNCLVVCVQNKALESIVDKLAVDSNLKFIVVGNDSRLNTTCKKYTIDGLIESREEFVSALAEFKRLGKITRLLARQYQKKIDICKKKGQTAGPEQDKWLLAWELYIDSKYSSLRNDSRAYDTQTNVQRRVLQKTCNEAYSEILESARIFVSTVDSVQNVQQYKDCVLVIDEAGVVPEFKMPALIVSHSVKSLIAIGDQKQLTPFSYTGNGYSFFHRLASNTTIPMLKTQYRMHPNICDMVSKAFYNDQLITWSSIVRSDGRVQWCNHDINEDGQRSKYNQHEIDVLTSTMKNCSLLEYIDRHSVMIITFYKEQFSRLLDMAAMCGLYNKITKCFVENFRIVTVDSAQGSEADTVILSCVRCNRSQSVGFIKNPSRLCVAVSRARERLIVLGSSRTMRAVDVLHDIYLRAKSSGNLIESIGI